MTVCGNFLKIFSNQKYRYSLETAVSAYNHIGYVGCHLLDFQFLFVCQSRLPVDCFQVVRPRFLFNLLYHQQRGHDLPFQPAYRLIHVDGNRCHDEREGSGHILNEYIPQDIVGKVHLHEDKACVLLADQVVDMPNRMELDNNLQYEYQKYMVARGYSELWINNHYVKEKEEFF